MTNDIDDTDDDLEEGVLVDFDDDRESRASGVVPVEHFEGCQCPECDPPDLRPLPPTDYPAAEPMYSLSELRFLLAGIDIGEGTLSLPEPVRVFGSLFWSAIEIDWWLRDAAWRARHVG